MGWVERLGALFGRKAEPVLPQGPVVYAQIVDDWCAYIRVEQGGLFDQALTVELGRDLAAALNAHPGKKSGLSGVILQENCGGGSVSPAQSAFDPCFTEGGFTIAIKGGIARWAQSRDNGKIHYISGVQWKSFAECVVALKAPPAPRRRGSGAKIFDII